MKTQSQYLIYLTFERCKQPSFSTSAMVGRISGNVSWANTASAEEAAQTVAFVLFCRLLMTHKCQKCNGINFSAAATCTPPLKNAQGSVILSRRQVKITFHHCEGLVNFTDNFFLKYILFKIKRLDLFQIKHSVPL